MKKKGIKSLLKKETERKGGGGGGGEGGGRGFSFARFSLRRETTEFDSLYIKILLLFFLSSPALREIPRNERKIVGSTLTRKGGKVFEKEEKTHTKTPEKA